MQVKYALTMAVKAFNNTDNNAEKARTAPPFPPAHRTGILQDIAQQIKKEFDKEYMVSMIPIQSPAHPHHPLACSLAGTASSEHLSDPSFTTSLTNTSTSS